MEAKFSNELKNVMLSAKQFASSLGNDRLNPEHLLLGLLNQRKGFVWDNILEDNLSQKKIQDLERRITAKIQSTPKLSSPSTPSTQIRISLEAELILKLTIIESKQYNSHLIECEHLLLALIKKPTTFISSILFEQGIFYDFVKEIVDSKFNRKGGPFFSDFDNRNNDKDDDEPFDEKSEDDEFFKQEKRVSKKSGIGLLEKYGRNLTTLAKEGALDPLVGREKILERVAQILGRKKKNNPILIGEAGVGKSAIAEGLALLLVQNKVSVSLINKKIISLDLASVMAGTKYRGQFEERMKMIIDTIHRDQDIILFIDEIHNIVGAGNSSGALDFSNLIKPALARGEIQCIGATTLDEYRKHIEKDGALERRFQKILVEPTTEEETLNILHNIKDKYEDYHYVTYTDEALKACVDLSQRFISDRFLPDKAIDALDEAGARQKFLSRQMPEEVYKIEGKVKILQDKKILAVENEEFTQAYELKEKIEKLETKIEGIKDSWINSIEINRAIVGENQIADVISSITGVPVNRISENEMDKLINIGNDLAKVIIGQNEAIEKVVRSVKRNRVGLKDPKRPIGSFIFLGPTGVGKTFFAKSLANYLFNSEDALVRIDMSEYMEKFAVSRLIGAPPGYVGYEEGGKLTEVIRRKPYSVILFDEIEKAHPDVYNILLQMLDDGILTDSLGRVVNFKNTIIIMTSNIGSRQLKDFGEGVGFSTHAKESGMDKYENSVVQNALKRSFSPEFLNRIDDIIMFKSLERKDIHIIIENELKDVFSRVNDIGYRIKITEAAKDALADKGWDKKYGARPLKRAIQKYISDALADIILENLPHGTLITVDFKQNEDNFIFRKRKKVPKQLKS